MNTLILLLIAVVLIILIALLPPAKVDSNAKLVMYILVAVAFVFMIIANVKVT
jgi:hypothetical protein